MLSVDLLAPAETVTLTVDTCGARVMDLCAGRRRLIGRIFGRADLDQRKALPFERARAGLVQDAASERLPG